MQILTIRFSTFLSLRGMIWGNAGTRRRWLVRTVSTLLGQWKYTSKNVRASFCAGIPIHESAYVQDLSAFMFFFYSALTEARIIRPVYAPFLHKKNGALTCSHQRSVIKAKRRRIT